MPHRVHRGHDGQQCLGGTNIRGRFFAANMLFARLQGQAQCLRSLGITRYTHESARHIALEGVSAGNETGMRAAETKRYTKPLGVAHSDIGAPFARRLQHCQGQ